MSFVAAAMKEMNDRDIIIHEVWDNIIVDTFTNNSNVPCFHSTVPSNLVFRKALGNTVFRSRHPVILSYMLFFFFFL